VQEVVQKQRIVLFSRTLYILRNAAALRCHSERSEESLFDRKSKKERFFGENVPQNNNFLKMLPQGLE
jgi:hypothetical protein